MEIKRDRYLQQIIDFMWVGQVKVITGIRRCGKSYLLNVLFRNYLLGQNIPPDNIIMIALDLTKDIQAYDVWKEKKLYGKTTMGVVHTTYLIDENGIIVKAFGKVKAKDNPAQMLEELS